MDTMRKKIPPSNSRGKPTRNELHTRKPMATHTNPECEINPDVKTTRGNAQLAKLLDKHPYVQYWLAAEYADKEIQNILRKLKNKNHMGAMEYQEKYTQQ